MLHTKPQGHLPFGSGEDFWRVFTKDECGGHLGHVTQTLWTNFRSPIPLRLHMKFGFDRPSGFGEEDLWKWWMTDRQQLCYKLTNEPKGSGELKKWTLLKNTMYNGLTVYWIWRCTDFPSFTLQFQYSPFYVIVSKQSGHCIWACIFMWHVMVTTTVSYWITNMFFALSWHWWNIIYN